MKEEYDNLKTVIDCLLISVGELTQQKTRDKERIESLEKTIAEQKNRIEQLEAPKTVRVDHASVDLRCLRLESMDEIKSRRLLHIEQLSKHYYKAFKKLEKKFDLGVLIPMELDFEQPSDDEIRAIIRKLTPSTAAPVPAVEAVESAPTPTMVMRGQEKYNLKFHRNQRILGIPAPSF